MRRFGTTLFPLALIAALAALTFWLERASNPDSPVRKAEKRHDPDYIVTQLDARAFAPDGSLKNAMKADSLTHYPDDDSTWVSQPRLAYHANGRITEATAKTAQSTRENKQVHLRGDVRLIRPSYGDAASTTLQTEELTVYPDEDIAEGVKRVTIQQGQSIVSGNRIHHNGKTSVTILAGQVKGTFYRTR